MGRLHILGALCVGFLFTWLILEREFLIRLRYIDGNGVGRDTGDGDVHAGCFSDSDATFSKLHGWESGVKVIPRPFQCPVRGFAIEDLEPELNYRRGYVYGHTNNMKDKTALFPYFLASHDITLQQSKRKIYLSLGPEIFDQDFSWTVWNYPLEFTEYHVFDYFRTFRIPRNLSKKSEGKGEEVAVDVGKMNKKGQILSARPPLTRGIVERIKVHDVVPSYMDGAKVAFWDEQKDVVKMSRVIQHDLQVKKEDVLIVKMDLKGHEYNILQEWLNNEYMLEVVDEIFVTFYYDHESLDGFTFKHSAWFMEEEPRYSRTREEVHDLFMKLRKKGFYIHFWP